MTEPTSATWRKSSKSSDGDCVEFRDGDDIGVRDSKDKAGPILTFSRQAWAAFVKDVPTR